MKNTDKKSILFKRIEINVSWKGAIKIRDINRIEPKVNDIFYIEENRWLEAIERIMTKKNA